MGLGILLAARGGRVMGWLALTLTIGVQVLLPQLAAAQTNSNKVAAIVISLEGNVEILPRGATNWVAAKIGHSLETGYQLRTGAKSRAMIRLSNLSVLRVGAWMTYEIEAPRTAGGKPGLNVKAGSAYFFSRDKPQETQVRTPTVTGAIRGTEFEVTVAPDGRTTLTMIDGEVELANAMGSVRLNAGEQGVGEAGRAPIKTAVLNAMNVIQWSLYYPGVLDLTELDFNPAEREALADSLAAYERGDLPAALHRYPANRQPASAADHLYLGGLLLAVGLVDQTLPHLEAATSGGGNNPALARAIRQVIAAVKFETWEPQGTQTLATEFLAESYYQQSRANLPAALVAARKAVEKSPGFAFAWERLAELEFSSGHTPASLEALNKSLALAPRNPQAIALKGFLLSARNQIPEAIKLFDEAIAIDGSLGNAWLGRGLCRIRRGQAEAGREDLQVAAALEPNRALLRSYLGKAFSETRDTVRAEHELDLARKFDPKDPTSWLYSALLHQQQNRINEAVRDLEQSQALNDNRSLFRSRLMLDEDLAVSSANLASIYRDAGMNDVSVREASRAVTYDYANAAAHLFLSDSYNEQRDPTRFNLRYETVWFNELLLANLLSPIGGGRLSQHVSQQEYSKLFQADGLGIANSTLARSDNKSVTELASQFGTFGGTSYALDLDYQHNDGFRPNNDLDSIEWYTTVKQQITPQDTLLALVKYEDYHSGDNFQYYDQTNARPNFRFDEYQHPIIVGGWHHEWSPGAHTLLLGGRVATEQDFSDRAAPQLLLVQDSAGTVYAADKEPFDVQYHGQSEVYLAELNQLFQWERVTLSLGGRWQGGSFTTEAMLANPPPQLQPPGVTLFNTPAAFAYLNEGFNRLTGYGYLTVEPLDRLWLTGGAAYDDVTYPDNYRNPPLSPGQAHTYQLGPKAGLVWSPISLMTLRGAYTRSLGGISADESYRLEQTQVAGFPQAFRSLISESVVGSVSAPQYETYAVALDLKLSSHTYAGIQAQWLNTDVDRSIGALTLENGQPPFVPTSTLEQLRYRENSLGISINQLLGNTLVVGASYKFDHVALNDTLPLVPVTALASAQQSDHADLYEVTGYVLFNHPSGLFARADATWYHQVNSEATMPGDDFVQENLYVGYRFLHRHAELMFGILNLSDQDYHLNPLNTYMELPRERSYIVRLNFVF
jgi:tetratricopeptide (TPR) repeat protein